MPPKTARPPKKGSKADLAAKEAKAAKKASANDNSGEPEDDSATVFDLTGLKGAIADDGGRQASGVLISEPRARDIKINAFSLSLHSSILVEDTVLELNHGSRYGLLGRNGCGKSTFLKCLAAKEVPIPDHFDVYLLDHEAPVTDMSALEYVVDSAQKEVTRLEALVEDILVQDGPDSPLLQDIYERLDEMDPTTFETRASIILVGLGFKPSGASLADGGATVDKKTKDMSGGWRMRVALSRALFLAPSILLLDEPTNHLDLEACVWLEDYLATYPKILVCVSHSQDFLNGVCTHMMVMQQQRLKYWTGNYDAYLKTKAAQDVNTIKLFKKQQEEIQHIKEFIASCGTYANLVRQAKSRQKILDKMEEDGLIEMPYEEPRFQFKFADAGDLSPPLISFSEVAFSYSGVKKDYLFQDVSFGIHPKSRLCLVGPNGAGKSTLLKLIVGDLSCTEGTISRRSGLSIGRFHQHSADVLDLAKTPIDYISSKFQLRYPANRLEEWRAVVGTYGIPKEYHMEPISKLSDGLKTRLVFCEIALNKPHLLLFDEPTNAADMEMIDSMAEAIRAFNGGVLVISHDFRLLDQVADEIWVVNHGLKVFDGNIRDYKKSLKAKFGYKKAT
jgi:ATP-binding cassette subfamily F protein 2